MLALLALAVLDSAPAKAPPVGRPGPVALEDPGWSFELAPYYWSASLSGSLAIDGEDVDIEDGGDGGLGPPTLLGYLGHFEARHGPWSYGFAPMFINASDMKGGQPPTTDANLTIRAQVHEAYVARDFAAGWQWLAGARYQDLETDMDLSIGGVPLSSHEGSKSWVDPIVGLRYTAQLGADWRVRARADVGGFGVGSDFVWNASALADYKFTKLFGMYAGYRALSFDFSDGSGSERVSYNLSMFGPIIGLSFSF